MVSASKTAANRRNAKKSTGPRTLRGKRSSALNALRHGGLSVVPVLPGVEKTAEWEAHRKATLASLAPSGYLETTFADRVAGLLWRLGRVTRYETENVASKLETAEDELAKNLEREADLDELTSRLSRRSHGLEFGEKPKGTTAAEIRDELEGLEDDCRAFLTLREYEDEAPFPPDRAETVLFKVAERAGVELEDLPLPGVPDEEAIGTWTGWTKKLVLEAVAAVAAAATSPVHKNPDDLWHYTGLMAQANHRAALTTLREVEARLQRSVRSRTLLPVEGLEKVARYETHLERSLFRALHELQRLQATRNGTGGAPMAFDLDVSVGPRVDRREPETLDAHGESVEP